MIFFYEKFLKNKQLLSSNTRNNFFHKNLQLTKHHDYTTEKAHLNTKTTSPRTTSNLRTQPKASKSDSNSTRALPTPAHAFFPHNFNTRKRETPTTGHPLSERW